MPVIGYRTCDNCGEQLRDHCTVNHGILVPPCCPGKCPGQTEWFLRRILRTQPGRYRRIK